MAWVLSAYGFQVNPLQLNEWMNTEGGNVRPFSDGGFWGASVNWKAIDFVSGEDLQTDRHGNGHFKEGTSLTDPTVLDGYLANGDLVVVQVKDSYGYQHWVTVKAKTNGDYSIMDPGFSDTSALLADYHTFWTYVVVSKAKGK